MDGVTNTWVGLIHPQMGEWKTVGALEASPCQGLRADGERSPAVGCAYRTGMERKDGAVENNVAPERTLTKDFWIDNRRRLTRCLRCYTRIFNRELV